jgi:hypothetical protein
MTDTSREFSHEFLLAEVTGESQRGEFIDREFKGALVWGDPRDVIT